MPVWEDQGYTRKDEDGNVISLDEYERTHKQTGIRAFINGGELKVYIICGVGFFLDAYDLFIINQVTPILQYEYWGGIPSNRPPPRPSASNPTGSPTYPPLLRGAVNAAANIGNVMGQVGFGFLGDAFGRKFVYGKELIVAMIGIIMTISLPNHDFGSVGKMWWLFAFRILMGVGIGGDYPLSAAIVAERSTLKNRGRMLALIFSNQGWGTLAASIVTLILLGCFKQGILSGHTGQVDGIWRLQIGLALVPAAALLYFRLTMPESRKFVQSTELSAVTASSIASSTSSFGAGDVEEKAGAAPKVIGAVSPEQERKMSIVEAHAAPPTKNVQMAAFIEYFSEWRHLKSLIGTASTWFLVDVAFYGLNLNQSVLLAQIGYSSVSSYRGFPTAGAYNLYYTLVNTAVGNLIIAAAGYVPGYFFTVAFIELLGRKPIQIAGFIITALMFGIIAGDWHGTSTGGKFALFTIAQLFFNFGPNATTFIVPAEAFPSRVRGLAHGFSAATGKIGAILSGLLFNYLSSLSFGTVNVLWIFFALNLFGAFMTVFFVPETKGIDADDIDYKEVQERVRPSHHAEGENGTM